MAQKVYAVNHDRRETMAVGHESWGGSDEQSVKERLEIYAPRHAAGRDQFFFILDKFEAQELMVQTEATKLEYNQVSGYWDTK